MEAKEAAEKMRREMERHWVATVERLEKEKAEAVTLHKEQSEEERRLRETAELALDRERALRVKAEEELTEACRKLSVVRDALECSICNSNCVCLALPCCGHMVCRDCDDGWRRRHQCGRNAASCPFCRARLRQGPAAVVKELQGLDLGDDN